MILSLYTYIASLPKFTSKPQRPFIRGQISQVKCNILFDTGSSITCINQEVFRNIPIDKRPVQISTLSSDKQEFLTAGGEKLMPKGLYELEFDIEGKIVKHPVFVLPKLHEKAIIGIDFMKAHGLNFCTQSDSFYWNDPSAPWSRGILSITQNITVEPFSTKIAHCNVTIGGQFKPTELPLSLALIQVANEPLLTGHPALVSIDSKGQTYVELHNTSPVAIQLSRRQPIGFIEALEEQEVCPMEDEELHRIKAIHQKQVALTPEKQKYITENAHLNVPSNLRQDYLQLFLKYHQVFSLSKNDLGRSNLIQHDIQLKTSEPIYVKHFKLPEAHREAVETQVLEWLKLGVIQPTVSKYNSPIFVVMKKDGGIRLVQDFRALNSQTYTDKYSMRDVQDCIDEIGRANSNIFSTIDLTSGFWQMILKPECRKYTAFTVMGLGQFEFKTSPMGLLGCPASFQRLMEAVTKGLPNILVYIDDLLVHSKSHKEQLQQLEALFQRLIQHNLKINIKKCCFGAKQVDYLGFTLTEKGVLPGSHKLKAVACASPPIDVKGVRQFLGLCNFFRNHVRNFAQITHPLTILTRKDTPWKGGPLPPEALKAFNHLKTILCSEPIVSFPRKNLPYALITDAATGDEHHPGGLGAILTQVNQDGEFSVLAYASRKLDKHERNYTPFLLEMQAAIWGMEHFSTYLRGRHFTLFTDHKPLEKLGKVHTKTLYRIQEAMLNFDFDIIYKKGSEMPADFLSRNTINSLQESLDIRLLQRQDTLTLGIIDFLERGTLPEDHMLRKEVQHYAISCFLENDVLWRRIHRHNYPPKVAIFAPRSMVSLIIPQFHGTWDSGHDGSLKVKEKILDHFYWPNMDTDITNYIKQCHKCQLRKKGPLSPKTDLMPLPQLTEPNMRVHMDLFGPLKTSEQGKKYILCMTDAFTKYVELVALPNKETITVMTAFFYKWICRYGVPGEIISDQGKEFVSNFSKELLQQLGAMHLTTTSRHPACNSQAEVANKEIAKYLSSFVDNSTLDWELYLAPMMFSYNTSFHRSIKTSPYFLTYGVKPRLPSESIYKFSWSDSPAQDLQQRFQIIRNIARQHNLINTQNYSDYYNDKVKPVPFYTGQQVLLDEHSFLHKNQKLAPKFSGPHVIKKIVNDVNAELLLQNGKRLLVHFNRIKPYFSSPQPVSTPTASNVPPIVNIPRPTSDVYLSDPPEISFPETRFDGGGISKQLSETSFQQNSPPIVETQQIFLSNDPLSAHQRNLPPISRPLTRSQTQNLPYDPTTKTFITDVSALTKKRKPYKKSRQFYTVRTDSDFIEIAPNIEAQVIPDPPNLEEESSEEEFPPVTPPIEEENPSTTEEEEAPQSEEEFFDVGPAPIPKPAPPPPAAKHLDKPPAKPTTAKGIPLQAAADRLRRFDQTIFGVPRTRQRGPVDDEKLPDKPLEYQKGKKK
jgi:hypothetical protein